MKTRVKKKTKTKKKKTGRKKVVKRVGPQFKARPKCIYNDEQAEEIGNNLEVIRQFHGGEVKPVEILEFAADKNSQLNKYFEWDNDKAGHKYRLSQARYMLSHVYIVVDASNGPEEVRAFISVSSEVHKGKRYTSVDNALTNENYREQTLSKALREVRLWQNKYGQYKELSSVFKAIDRLSF